MHAELAGVSGDRTPVITGVGIICALGTGREAVTAALRADRPGLTAITGFDAAPFPSRVAGLAPGFDPAAFLDRRTLMRQDRVLHLAVAASDLAVRDAALAPGSWDPRRVAVTVSSGKGGAAASEDAMRALIEHGPGAVKPRRHDASFVPAAVGIRHGVRGPTLGFSCASATGLFSLAHAADLVRLGRADLVLAGAAEAPVTPFTLASFASLGVLATAEPGDPYYVFDRRRRGMVLGEGAAVLVIESREHAMRRGARVRAELAGSGLAGEAHGYFDFDPAGSGGTDAMGACLLDAGLAPAGIDTIVAHGTGTRVNDAYESTVLGAVFGPDASRPLVVGTKPLTGHTLGASGAVEAALLVLMMDAGIVPTPVNWGERDPDCALRYTRSAEDRPPRVALVCAYGFGGFCGCLAVTAPSSLS